MQATGAQEQQPLQVIGISGSLRKGSFNSMALRAACSLAPQDMQIEIAQIRDIPLYDEDLRAQGEPLVVAALKERLRAADAVLIVTPEYNFSLPGPLKNAIDWVSRPPAQPFDGKVVAIMGASTGQVGTARAQYDLRKMMVCLNAFTVNKPEVFIREAAGKFDKDGRLTDEATAKAIGDLLLSALKLKQRLG